MSGFISDEINDLLRAKNLCSNGHVPDLISDDALTKQCLMHNDSKYCDDDLREIASCHIKVNFCH